MNNINNPEAINLLNPTNFLFGVQKYPELNYYMQAVSMPTITLGQAMQSSSVHDLKMPGETVDFADLDITFLVDEEMKNYLAIQNWMFGLGYPETTEMFKNLLGEKRNEQSYTTASKTVSDCFLHILSSSQQQTHRFTFVDAFPVSLSAISFQSTDTDIRFVQATASFAYSYFKKE